MRRWQHIFGLLSLAVILTGGFAPGARSFGFDTRKWKELARPGAAVRNRDHWPKGLLGFLNLPQRGMAVARATNLEPFIEYYYYTVQDLDQLQTMVNRFAEIESDGLCIVFAEPEDGEPVAKLGAEFTMDENLKTNPPTLLVVLPRASDAAKLNLPGKITVKRRVLQKPIGGDIVTIF